MSNRNLTTLKRALPHSATVTQIGSKTANLHGFERPRLVFGIHACKQSNIWARPQATSRSLLGRSCCQKKLCSRSVKPPSGSAMAASMSPLNGRSFLNASCGAQQNNFCSAPKKTSTYCPCSLASLALSTTPSSFPRSFARPIACPTSWRHAWPKTLGHPNSATSLRVSTPLLPLCICTSVCQSYVI